MEDINLDFDSSDAPKKESMPKWKKYLLIGGIISAFSILLIIIIILLISQQSKDSEESKPETPEIPTIGQIKCRYYITNTENSTQILGKNFIDEKNLIIIIIIYNITGPINMDYMFKDVSAITSVLMYSNGNAEITSMISSFENCKNLIDITLSGFDTSNVKSMSHVFYNSKIEIINLVGIDSRNVEDFSYMFSHIDSNNIDLGILNTKSAKNMSHMFEKSNFKILDFSNIDTSNVEDMSYMFSSCDSITELDLSKFDTKNVKDMSGMFMDCISLTSIDMSSFDTSQVTDNV